MWNILCFILLNIHLNIDIEKKLLSICYIIKVRHIHTVQWNLWSLHFLFPLHWQRAGDTFIVLNWEFSSIVRMRKEKDESEEKEIEKSFGKDPFVAAKD